MNKVCISYLFSVFYIYLCLPILLYFFKFGMEYFKTKCKSKFGDFCIPDSGTTHTILKSEEYYIKLKLTKANVYTISGPVDLIEGIGKAKITLPNRTKFLIEEALFSPN